MVKRFSSNGAYGTIYTPSNSYSIMI
jgi:hypothetical protein